LVAEEVGLDAEVSLTEPTPSLGRLVRESAAVGVGRIIPTLRSLISVPAGLVHMSPRNFLLLPHSFRPLESRWPSQGSTIPPHLWPRSG
jgi:hypothetical protein